MCAVTERGGYNRVMDTIDVLAGHPGRHAAVTRELLAEAEDAELAAIVEQAARELGAPPHLRPLPLLDRHSYLLLSVAEMRLVYTTIVYERCEW